VISFILCVLLTGSFFIFFKYFDKFKVNTFQAIVVNYFVCAIVGLWYSGGIPLEVKSYDPNWMIFGSVLGLLFISCFFLMAKTAQSISVAVSSVASKMSLILSSVLSVVFVTGFESFGVLNILGLLLSVLAVGLVTYQPSLIQDSEKIKKSALLVGAVFLGTGFLDAIINMANHYFVYDHFQKVFPVFCFSIAFIAGIISVVFSGKKFQLKDVIAGVALGIPNYFSIYFLLQALSFFDNDGSLVFPILNLSVILLSSLLAFLLFGERLSKVNLLGVIVAILSLVVLMWR